MMALSKVVFALCLVLLTSSLNAQAQPTYTPVEGDVVLKNFKFQSGESLPELRMHYTAIGKPKKDANGRVINAVLLLHGTGGSGKSLMRPIFSDVLFGRGQLLDTERYYIILPDNIGHGKSSKPSDGLRTKFPQYDYDDMVVAQKRLLEEGLGVNHLRLILGTSMGCMHAFVWAVSHPNYMDALMPLACQPVAIAGRNRVWRKMAIDAVRNDPEWLGGNYNKQPRAAVTTAANLLILAGGAPIQMQKNLPTREAADKFVEETVARNAAELDANDFMYAVASSRNYDPSPGLEKIKVPVMFINTADDFINPPELAIAEREIKRIKQGKFVLLPATEATFGHGTHTRAAVWAPYLKELLENSVR
ncbi:MAG: alpha/beta fold hydrolase [Rhodocyclaceae bacterium]|nr:alpha/beta fold hydrolase [Rhodocyclaceae bacterium]MCA3083819.1 alpha/beta fold hydrolase [Rhodocyclaceae bacterium]